ncbi:MAG: DUF2066 domain-containing protein [Coxiellaceae bacterium]|nr:DUF2066 domain-containing protein [Coxiellaceae bacterium]
MSISISVISATNAFGMQETISLYAVEMPVANNSEIELKRIFPKALKDILIRISHDSKIDTLSEVKKALNNPDIYVRQFKYFDQDDCEYIQIIFDEKSIFQLLQRVSKINEPQIPATLIWFTKNIHNKFITERKNRDELTALAEKQSIKIGLPIVLPSWDLEDAKQINTNDICYFNSSKIRAASHRYKTSSIAVGCLKPVIFNDAWSSVWMLLQNGRSQYFSINGTNINEVIAGAFKKIANSIAITDTDIAINHRNNKSKLIIRIIDVNGLDGYNEVVNYLYSLNKNAITQIDLITVNTAYIELAVQIFGGKETLLKIIQTQHRLIPNLNINNSLPKVDLNYKWVI